MHKTNPVQLVDFRRGAERKTLPQRRPVPQGDPFLDAEVARAIAAAATPIIDAVDRFVMWFCIVITVAFFAGMGGLGWWLRAGA